MFENESEEEEYDPNKVNFLKKISSLGNANELINNKRKSVKFYLDNNIANQQNSLRAEEEKEKERDCEKSKNEYKYNLRNSVVEGQIKIGQDVIDKERIDLLSKHILKNCNYFHSKNKNNNHTTKKREGNTMITNGMTVGGFYKRFNL